MLKLLVLLQEMALILLYAVDTVCNPDAKRLYDDLLRRSGYNKLIRPVSNISDQLKIQLGLRLSQLIDVDEKNQIMTTNVWITQDWVDYKLGWDPKQYGGVDVLYVPSEEIWLPDIVLYNNADGNYEVTLMTKATIRPTGRVHWEPPAIYKSSCTMDVEFFPFDEQLCTMVFGSWTYEGSQVDLEHVWHESSKSVGDSSFISHGIDLKDFYTSVEWDLLSVPANKTKRYYKKTQDFHPEITFYITIRRKTLFYTVNLIVPCVSISFLTVIVFHLPSDSGEKVALSISILLSLTVFFLLLAEIIPPTSLVVPLIGKYLLFTMFLVTLSIIVTTFVLNVHFRSHTSSPMPQWTRKFFLDYLPRVLCMRRPRVIERGEFTHTRTITRTCNGIELRGEVTTNPKQSNGQHRVMCEDENSLNGSNINRTRRISSSCSRLDLQHRRFHETGFCNEPYSPVTNRQILSPEHQFGTGNQSRNQLRRNISCDVQVEPDLVHQLSVDLVQHYRQGGYLGQSGYLGHGESRGWNSMEMMQHVVPSDTSPPHYSTIHIGQGHREDTGQDLGQGQYQFQGHIEGQHLGQGQNQIQGHRGEQDLDQSQFQGNREGYNVHQGYRERQKLGQCHSRLGRSDAFDEIEQTVNDEIHDDDDEEFQSPEIARAVEGAKYIASHLQREDTITFIKEDWKYMALVLDRLFLWLFSTACFVGMLCIILQAPSIYDKRTSVPLAEDTVT